MQKGVDVVQFQLCGAVSDPQHGGLCSETVQVYPGLDIHPKPFPVQGDILLGPAGAYLSSHLGGGNKMI